MAAPFLPGSLPQGGSSEVILYQTRRAQAPQPTRISNRRLQCARTPALVVFLTKAPEREAAPRQAVASPAPGRHSRELARRFWGTVSNKCPPAPAAMRPTRTAYSVVVDSLPVSARAVCRFVKRYRSDQPHFCGTSTSSVLGCNSGAALQQQRPEWPVHDLRAPREAPSLLRHSRQEVAISNSMHQHSLDMESGLSLDTGKQALAHCVNTSAPWNQAGRFVCLRVARTILPLGWRLLSSAAVITTCEKLQSCRSVTVTGERVCCVPACLPSNGLCLRGVLKPRPGR